MSKHDPRRSVRAGAAVAVAGMAAAAGLAYAPAAVAASTSYAYGVSASGLVDITPTPYVKSSGAPAHAQLVKASLPPESSLVTAKLLNVHANEGKAKAHVVGLSLGNEQLLDTLDDQVPEQLRGQLSDLEQQLSQLAKKVPGAGKAVGSASSGLISAQVLKARCHKGEGRSKILKLRVGGEKIEVPAGLGKVDPNTTIALPPEGATQLVEITLNKQVQHDDGSLTVTALQIKLLEGTPAEQVINVAQAHCGGDGEYDEGGKDSPSPQPTEPENPQESEKPGPDGQTDAPDDPETSGPEEKTDAPSSDEADVPAAPAPEPATGNFPITG